MGVAARILTDGFYGTSNPIVYLSERLRTYLSLESDFPTPRYQHEVLVACRSSDGKVIGLLDIDNRLKQKPRPYMCNLAIDLKWRNKGLAKALICKSEQVSSEEWQQTEIYLKVRESNVAALSLYKNLGYQVVAQSIEAKTSETLLTMRKSLLANQNNNTAPSTTSTAVPKETGQVLAES